MIDGDFERLLRRPRNYFRLRADRQWEIDKQLGVLDVELSRSDFTVEMTKRWEEHFD